MDDTGISARVIEEIRQLAEKYSIEQVLLFGSRARGDYRRTSDIDLAVRWVLSRPGLFLNTVGDLGLLPKVLVAADRGGARPSDAEMAEDLICEEILLEAKRK